MKKIISLSAIFLCLVFISTSCGKYDEGPAISLKSKKARVAGTYITDQVYINGLLDNDALEFMNGLEVTFEKDGTGTSIYRYSLGTTVVTEQSDLEWMFNDDETMLLVRSKDDGVWDEWEEQTIIKLTNTEIWVQYYDNFNQLWEVHMLEK